MTQFTRWSTAMERALYGPGGFYRREVPYYHFSTSAQAPVFAEAIAQLAEEVDVVLGRPSTFDVVDVGAGNGELLGHLEPLLDDRARLTAVERRPRPSDLPERVRWETSVPEGVTGLVVACELLDNVPCDVAVVDEAGDLRYEEVDEHGSTRPGEPVSDVDAKWLSEWWPIAEPGERAEVGLPREAMWRDLTEHLDAGTVLAIDYGHEKSSRPEAGSVSAFRNGREVRPVPDGSCDITAHVAVDAIPCDRTQRQRDALKTLGLPIERPQLAKAYRDPTGYAVDLARASAAARLTDPGGLGAHWWMLSFRNPGEGSGEAGR